MSMSRKISYVLLILGIALFLSTAGCVQPDDARILMEFQDQGKILPEDGASIASSAMIEARLLGVNFSESEITSRATELAAELTKKYAESYNEERGWYEIDWNAYHLSIGRVYDLTDDEIRRYVKASTRTKVYGMHNQQVPADIYKDVLDSEHKAAA